jgi:hypothetical protein
LTLLNRKHSEDLHTVEAVAELPTHLKVVINEKYTAQDRVDQHRIKAIASVLAPCGCA